MLNGAKKVKKFNEMIEEITKNNGYTLVGITLPTKEELNLFIKKEKAKEKQSGIILFKDHRYLRGLENGIIKYHEWLRKR